jgi:glycosyltransferase involved in cell wall biosynthesis
MDFTVITSAPLVKKADGYYAYGPYVREMEIWARHTGRMHFACPVMADTDGLFTRIDFPVGKIYPLRSFDVKSAKGTLRAIRFSIINFWMIFQAMKAAGHIHLRCPGNIGLMGCLVQILFPKKKKTAKYAGNWDPNSQQPLSYRMQKWLLNNTFLTRNMQVLVYGEWPGSSKNIKPFFTATYWESDKLKLTGKELQAPIEFVFAGSLAVGKRPKYALELIRFLKNSGMQCRLRFFGDGSQRRDLEDFIQANNLQDTAQLCGNQPAEVVAQAFRESHFAILPSKSEGWPKAVAEAMFWECLPMATPVSCVPYMLDSGRRGIILSLNAQKDSESIRQLMANPEMYRKKVTDAALWSRQFTLDLFEDEIVTLL